MKRGSKHAGTRQILRDWVAACPGVSFWHIRKCNSLNCVSITQKMHRKIVWSISRKKSHMKYAVSSATMEREKIFQCHMKVNSEIEHKYNYVVSIKTDVGVHFVRDFSFLMWSWCESFCDYFCVPMLLLFRERGKINFWCRFSDEIFTGYLLKNSTNIFLA